MILGLLTGTEAFRKACQTIDCTVDRGSSPMIELLDHHRGLGFAPACACEIHKRSEALHDCTAVIANRADVEAARTAAILRR